jgi:hypothetical protein
MKLTGAKYRLAILALAPLVISGTLPALATSQATELWQAPYMAKVAVCQSRAAPIFAALALHARMAATLGGLVRMANVLADAFILKFDSEPQFQCLLLIQSGRDDGAAQVNSPKLRSRPHMLAQRAARRHWSRKYLSTNAPCRPCSGATRYAIIKDVSRNRRQPHHNRIATN